MQVLAKDFHGARAMALHALTTLPFWLALAGVATSYYFYLRRPDIPAAIKARFGRSSTACSRTSTTWTGSTSTCWRRAARAVGTGLWRGGDVAVIDGDRERIGALGGGVAGVVRLMQNGYLYWYALVMILGVMGLMTWQLWPFLAQLLGLLKREHTE